MDNFDIKDFLSYLSTKIYIIFLFLILSLGLGNLYICYFQVPMYSSETTLILVNERKNTEESIEQSDILLNQTLVATYSEIIKSRKVLSEVINNLNLDYKEDELADNIKVSSVNDTEIIKIRVNDEESKLAKDIAKELVAVFSNEIQQIYNIQNISIVDEAEVNNKPYNINYIKQEIVYTLLGIVVGSIIIFLTYYFDSTIKKEEDIEKKLGLTVIGRVPNANK